MLKQTSAADDLQASFSVLEDTYIRSCSHEHTKTTMAQRVPTGQAVWSVILCGGSMTLHTHSANWNWAHDVGDATNDTI